MKLNKNELITFLEVLLENIKKENNPCSIEWESGPMKTWSVIKGFGDPKTIKKIGYKYNIDIKILNE